MVYLYTHNYILGTICICYHAMLDYFLVTCEIIQHSIREVTKRASKFYKITSPRWTKWTGLNPRKFQCFTRPNAAVYFCYENSDECNTFPLPSSCSNRDWDSTVPLSTQFTRRVFTSCNYLQVLFPYNDIIQVFHLVQILQLSQYLPLSLCVLV